jgi:predicted enzyme related to lactoylglutathione lyase
MITGVHTILFSPQADKIRAFLRDVCEWSSVDAGGGWPIFAQPASEMAVHPDDTGGRAEIYLMCDDLGATLAKMSEKGIHTAGPVHEERWGIVARLTMPDGSELGIYQPKHPRP